MRSRRLQHGWGSMVVDNRTVSPSDRNGGRCCCVPLGHAATAAASLVSLSMFAPAPAVAFPYGEYGQYEGYGPRESSYERLAPPRFVRKHTDPNSADPAKSQSAKSQSAKSQSAKSQSDKSAAKPQPPKPVGPLIIAVSIGSQHVTVYDNGSPIAT